MFINDISLFDKIYANRHIYHRYPCLPFIADLPSLIVASPPSFSPSCCLQYVKSLKKSSRSYCVTNIRISPARAPKQIPIGAEIKLITQA